MDGSGTSREPFVSSAANSIASQLERLENQVESLSNRLKPVLREEPTDAPAAKANAREVTTPLADDLYSYSGRISATADSLGDLLSRMEL